MVAAKKTPTKSGVNVEQTVRRAAQKRNRAEQHCQHESGSELPPDQAFSQSGSSVNNGGGGRARIASHHVRDDDRQGRENDWQRVRARRNERDESSENDREQSEG